MRPEQYTYIAAWGRYLGSQWDYIKGQQQQAAWDNAPADALYKRDDGFWFCRSSLLERAPTVAAALDRDVARMRGE